MRIELRIKGLTLAFFKSLFVIVEFLNFLMKLGVDHLEFDCLLCVL